MADLRVRFIGDAGNLRSFFASIAGQADVAANSLNKLGRVNIAQQLNILPNLLQRGIPAGASGIKNLAIEFDKFNNVIKATGQTAIKLRSGELLPIADFTRYASSVDEVVAGLQNYSNAINLGESTRKTLKSDLNDINRAFDAQKRVLTTPIVASRRSISALRQGLPALNDQITAARALVAPQPFLDSATQRFERQNTLNPLLKQRLQLIGAIGREQINLNKLEGNLQNLFQNDPVLNALNKRRDATRQLGTQTLLQIRRDRQAAQTQLEQAFGTSPTFLPTNLRNLQTLSPQLFQTLQKAGLGSTPQAVYDQQAKISAPRADLIRGVTRFSGEFIKTTQAGIPIVQEFSAEIDKNGKVVTRFGGQLSGASQVLKQITRDFQKVIEWTVATTLVFGSLQYTIEQLRNLQELDYALAKFAITAQQSPAQARESFGQLAQIAYNTATPLLEIVGAADDIALATQRAGQSTEAWQRQIFQLTESVGVFTNLTGIDTVQATDLLTATMKQLRLTAADIPAILSKITAVAGGQSQAIADITKGLSVMAEAGRVAGLSLDQQIATVQVLSQVTSKTPAEVATAFKNLVGSLGSPAALKGLESFNIGVRDQQGNLRNILDIYGEIAAKIKGGIIPAADVAGLIRAISGGPRRAPDAAALLAAIDQITTAQQRSALATNEAAIANAKAIDTTKAKLIQLQTTIDAVTFEKFGGEFKTLIASFTTLLTSILETFNKIPTGVVSAAIQIGLFFVAVRGGTRLLSFLTSYLRETATAFLQVGQSAATSTGLVNQFGAALTRTQAASLTGGLRGNLGRIGISAGIGAGLSAASGGGLNQVIGGGLQGLGIGLLAIPEPTFITKAAGAIALLGGTILQFFNDTGQANVDSAEKAILVLDAFSKFKSSSFDVDNLTRSQSNLANEIDRLSNTANKNAEEFARLENAQRDYASGVLESIDATKQAYDARIELIAVLSQGSDTEKALANELKLSTRYATTSEALEKLIIDYQKVILLRANPDLVFPDFESLPRPDFSVGRIPVGPSSGATRDTVRGPINIINDLKELETAPEKVKQLFSGLGDAITSEFALTSENINLISDAITRLEEKGDPLAQTLRQTFTAFESQNDILKQTANNLAIYQSYLDALTFLNPTQAAELQRLLDLVRIISSTAPTGAVLNEGVPTKISGERGEAPTIDLRQESLTILHKALEDGKVDYVELKRLGTDFYNSMDAETKENTTLTAFLGQLFEKLGFDLEKIGIEGPAAIQSISDAALDAADALEGSLGSIRENVSGRLAQLRQDFQAGEIKEGPYKKLSADLRAYLSLVDQVGPKFQNSISSVAGFDETLRLIQDEFEGIIGLENAATLSSDEFVSQLLTLADTYGLNGQQLDALAVKLANFHKLVEDLNRIRVNIPIGVSLDLTSVRAALSKLRLALQNSTGGPSTVGNPLVQAQLSGLLQLEKLLSQISSTTSGIRSSFYSGSGTPTGTLSSGSGSTATKTGLDISELDIPEEILKSPEMQNLIKQAIASARALQSSIPGATKEGANDLVVLLDGMTKVMQVSGIKSEYLRKALEELAEIERKRLEFETKADTIRRIRVGAGDFSAIANVPVNLASGVSVGSQNQINITFNLNGQNLTPAQFDQFANMIGAEIARRL